ncbi:SPFH domain-containing protein [Actinomadura gamaensis]|uniref:SPFH domain-containing protein n=1 Tax=Actinomadura gamaensis TaxID=1763541 RepID=A0ABV9TXU3_9ACTN
MSATLILAVVVIAVGGLLLYRSVRIVPQAMAYIVERLGRYDRTMPAGLNMVVPFMDQIRNRVDLREQVVPFVPQAVITSENLVVSIDTVLYYQVTDAKAATYEVSDFLSAIEQLTATTLRNIIGGMDLERTLTSREEINSELRGVLDEATGKWGIRVNRVELKAVDPPDSIKDAMEKQTRADRDKRASILTAEGQKQAAILTAEGERTSAVLRARGEAEAVVLSAEADAKAQATRARGQAQAIATVFKAIHDGRPDQRLLAYQYLQTLPKIAEGSANKVWVVPAEMARALDHLGGFFNGRLPADEPNESPEPGAAPTSPSEFTPSSGFTPPSEFAGPSASGGFAGPSPSGGFAGPSASGGFAGPGGSGASGSSGSSGAAGTPGASASGGYPRSDAGTSAAAPGAEDDEPGNGVSPRRPDEDDFRPYNR